jgi:hypothetical protein
VNRCFRASLLRSVHAIPTLFASHSQTSVHTQLSKDRRYVNVDCGSERQVRVQIGGASNDNSVVARQALVALELYNTHTLKALKKRSVLMT